MPARFPPPVVGAFLPVADPAGGVASVRDVVLAPPRSVLKTSSGKIRRAACRALYEQGRLGVTQRAPWRQWLALALEAAAAQARSTRRSAALWAWGLWAWAVFVALGTVAWFAVMLLPSLRLRRRAAWTLARLATRLIRLPVQVQGLRRLPARGARIVVANHASYLDSLVLTAALPAGIVAEDVIPLTVPGLNAERHLIILKAGS